ncbi:two-component system, chemotaxis family, response regulator CheB [Rhizobium tibeticum]|uniref:Chemotaxis-specific methylesterase n=1 Tax=Rhizobium tibeticum TaxID=501024 RepID=A0A1H8R3E6_9HYPH|nr:chemotaxis-specific methylesterase [Rhizobium tibeticum]SEO61189.1 two-component system, chemotaxis family, response regulator CheB [Rhizobium tibeticum]
MAAQWACWRCIRPAPTRVAQDEAPSVVVGMPKEAIAKGGADRFLPLDQIARVVLITQQTF